MTDRRAFAADWAPRRLFVGGEWRDAEDGRTLLVEDPASATDVADVADAGLADETAATDAAVVAGADWAGRSPRTRADVLRGTYQALRADGEHFAQLMSWETGRPLRESRAELDYAADYFRWYGEEAVRVGGRTALAPDGDSRITTVKEPVGVCLFVTPWNFPLAMAARKIAPALAAGCTCVVKPAAQTPMTMLALARTIDAAGVTPGAINVVPTSRSGELVAAVMADARVRKLSFTGSTEVGRLLARQASEQLQRVSMELGGNAPFLVLADADLDAAIEGAVVAKLRNGGQACTAANRFYVHESLAAEFGERLAARFAAIDVEDVGPLIDAHQRRRVADLVDEARSAGARVLCGGVAPARPGYFFAPTVLADVPVDAAILRSEVFGPVAPVVSVADDDEALRLANATEHGLAAYVYTRDLVRARRAVARLSAGMVAVNRGGVSNVAAPFGGIKQSGFGREGGPEGIEEYLDIKYVAEPAARCDTEVAV